MARVDSCGVCGGDGLSCVGSADRRVYAWTEVPLSQCSAPCGGGHMMAHAVCVNNATREKVHEDLCDVSTKPEARMAPCNNSPCPAR